MKAAIILFVYARSEHTEKVLEALKKNVVKPQMLYIFQDGKKENTNLEEWKRVNVLINSIDWCKTEVIVADRNRGLAESIITGTNYVAQYYDAFAVLEDDCVPHSLWFKYMYGALQKYEQAKEVMCVNGCFRKADVEKNGKDAYFAGRASSWGWGTWKDRWQEFSLDYKVLGRIKKDEYKYKQLQIWGKDLENYLIQTIYGTADSWAALWALHIIDKNGFCLTPYQSLICNIGTDGTGVHCGNAYVELGVRKEEDLEEFEFPDIVEFPTNYDTAFQYYWSWVSKETKLGIYNGILFDFIRMKQQGYSLTSYFEEKNIKEIAIWGKGNICDLLIREVADSLKIKCIIESQPSEKMYHDYPIEKIDDIHTENLGIIVIPVYDYAKIRESIDESKFQIWRVDSLIKDILGE